MLSCACSLPSPLIPASAPDPALDPAAVAVDAPAPPDDEFGPNSTPPPLPPVVVAVSSVGRARMAEDSPRGAEGPCPATVGLGILLESGSNDVAALRCMPRKRGRGGGGSGNSGGRKPSVR